MSAPRLKLRDALVLYMAAGVGNSTDHDKQAQARLSALNALSANVGQELHKKIMNLRTTKHREPEGLLPAYKRGHRDARHAAAELALRVPELEALRKDAERFRLALEDVLAYVRNKDDLYANGAIHQIVVDALDDGSGPINEGANGGQT